MHDVYVAPIIPGGIFRGTAIRLRSSSSRQARPLSSYRDSGSIIVRQMVPICPETSPGGVLSRTPSFADQALISIPSNIHQDMTCSKSTLLTPSKYDVVTTSGLRRDVPGLVIFRYNIIDNAGAQIPSTVQTIYPSKTSSGQIIHFGRDPTPLCCSCLDLDNAHRCCGGSFGDRGKCPSVSGPSTS